MLVALLMLNMVLVQLVLWSNQCAPETKRLKMSFCQQVVMQVVAVRWIMYAIMIIPNAIHFLYVKCRAWLMCV